ncbi:FAD-dependent oxidoreductase [Georgenia sp. MJ206]|uniref:FAD-dependent oxidoreductase n=1 Tax=Georgenia wangjunii TaxID=3117730 RepID=UPI002F26568E
MTSLWLDRPDIPRFPAPPAGASYDVVVVGAGLTGLTTALLLARAGCTVAVLEARGVGAATTGNTTAKVSLLQGTKLSRISRHHPASVVQDYVEASSEGQAWLTRYCADHGIATQRRDAFTYATTEEGLAAVEAEVEAAGAAGLPVELVPDAGLPYPTLGAARLADQVQLDPMDVLVQLARDVIEHGGEIYGGSRVVDVASGKPCTVHTEDGTVRADRVVLATGIPVLDRGGFFAGLEPQRSYALAFAVPGTVPTGMYLSADSPTRSLRTAPGADGELLLVGGSGHTVGRAESPRGHVEELMAWTTEHFPGAELTHSWSAQDYRPVDDLPVVGPLTATNDRILVATGYDKWGMTSAVAMSLALSAQLLGGSIPWAHSLRSWRSGALRGAASAVRLNAEVAARLATDWAKPRPHSRPGVRPPEGEGRVELDGVRPVATSTVDGTTRRHSAVCPHLGGILSWNDAERSWDCPLHGSRFAADGSVLEGPALCGLRALTPDP